MTAPQALPALIEALRKLPGVGVKSASRMAYHLLQHDRAGAQFLARALDVAVQEVQHCQRCHTFTQGLVCDTCLDPDRDASRLCVVESPADQSAVERSGAYQGLYYVLLGRLSPLDGLGPKDLGLQALLQRVLDGGVTEVIVATSFTGEGEATAHVISQMLRERNVRVTRLARGVPVGSELEFVDLGTIAHALTDRR